MNEEDLGSDPIAAFVRWFADAEASGLRLPHAMTLATVGGGGTPNARVVLLKRVDEAGFVFYTNYESAKAREIEADPRVALVFYWDPLDRQVRVVGRAVKVARPEAEAYWATRPRGSRLGAWASPQSRVIAGRAVLDDEFAALDARYPGDDIPLPDHWGGFVVAPEEIEFWSGRPNRLHDRIRFRRAATGGWTIERLAP